jgi:hypothetical protein
LIDSILLEVKVRGYSVRRVAFRLSILYSFATHGIGSFLLSGADLLPLTDKTDSVSCPSKTHMPKILFSGKKKRLHVSLAWLPSSTEHYLPWRGIKFSYLLSKIGFNSSGFCTSILNNYKSRDKEFRIE